MSTFKHSPQEARKLWVEALRSGQFNQCQERMRWTSAGGHCCLDVARIVCERAEGLSFALTDDDLNLRNFPAVQEWLGLDSPTGMFRTSTGQSSLEKKNDGGYSFCDIADLIESAPPGLFVEDPA